jgi:hypothetical protein
MNAAKDRSRGQQNVKTLRAGSLLDLGDLLLRRDP